MGRKRNYSYIVPIVAAIIGGLWIVAKIYFLCVIMFIPDWVSITAVFEDNTFKIATDPSDLLRRNKKLSRFTAVHFYLQNHSKETCQGKIKAEGIDDNLEAVVPEGGIW